MERLMSRAVANVYCARCDRQRAISKCLCLACGCPNWSFSARAIVEERCIQFSGVPAFVVARIVPNYLPATIERLGGSAELISEGQLGLLHAARRFEVGRGAKFISYAIFVVRRRLVGYIGSKAMNKRALPPFEAFDRESLEAWPDLRAIDPAECAVHSEELFRLHQALAGLPGQWRRILERRADGDTWESLAEDEGADKNRLRNIQAAALNRLRRTVAPIFSFHH